MEPAQANQQNASLQSLESAHQDGPPVRFGLIGAGRLATKALAPALHAARGVTLHSVAARSADRAAKLEPSNRAYGDYQALIEDDEVEVVYVALNNAGHLPWVLTALRAGKHVLCEKPIGLSEADAVTMIDAAGAAGRLLVEAFWYRWHPRTLRLNRLLSRGDLGPITHVEADFSYSGADSGDLTSQYRYDPDGGGGALYDVGCYALSFAHLALGPSLAVTGASARIGPTGVDLENSVTLATPDGATARVRSAIAGQAHQQGDVAGELASASLSSPVFGSLFTPSSLTLTTAAGAVTTEQFEGEDPYRVMVESLAARVRGEPAFLVDLEHTRQIAHSADAALAAFASSD